MFHVDVEGLVLEPPAVELSLLAVNIKAIRSVDGLVIGNVTKALEGRGTVIRAQPLKIRTAQYCNRLHTTCEQATMHNLWFLARVPNIFGNSVAMENNR